MGMRVTVSINGSPVAILDLVRTDIGGDSAPGVGTGDYTAALTTSDPKGTILPPETWIVVGHDRATGVLGLIVDALAQRPE